MSSRSQKYRLIEADNIHLMRLATRLSVFVALCLVTVKAAAWFLTDSLSVLSSLIDSAMDGATSLVNFMALRYSLRPPDEKHRFGFGKAEPVASLFQSGIIIVSAAYIAVHALLRLQNPVPLKEGDVGIWVMGISLIASIWLVWFQRRVIRQTDSLVVRADSLHYMTDILSNSAVIVSLLLAHYGGIVAADAALALVISAFVGYGALKIGYDAFHNIVDQELPEAERQEIIALIRAHGEVQGVNDLRTRLSGQIRFIQFNLELNGDLPLRTAHRITHHIEDELLARFPNAEIIIHQDVTE